MLLAAGMLTGCTGRDDTAPPALPDGVRVAFVQLRSDVAARQGQVEVRNDTDAAIEVGEVAVTDPRFDGVAERAMTGRTSTVAAGSTVDIRIQLPPVECGVGEGTATVQLVIDGSRYEGPLPDPLDVLGPLRERECLAERVADAATLSFSSFAPSAAGEPATLTLSIAPTGAAAATISGIQTTNLLTFDAGAGATGDTSPIELEIAPVASEPVDVALPLVPLRCDPHAVQEDKRGTIFTLEVVVDGSPGEIELAASEDLRGEILTWVGDWCGFGA